LGHPRTLLGPFGVQPDKLELVQPSSWSRNGGKPKHAPLGSISKDEPGLKPNKGIMR